MSLGKEDNKALQEIKLLSFWCEAAGQTPSNPAPKGRSEAFKSLKPPWAGLSRELPWGSAAPSCCQAGGRGDLCQERGTSRPKSGVFSAFQSVGWDGSKAVCSRVSQSLGIPRAALRIQHHP